MQTNRLHYGCIALERGKQKDREQRGRAGGWEEGREMESHTEGEKGQANLVSVHAGDERNIRSINGSCGAKGGRDKRPKRPLAGSTPVWGTLS